MSSSESREHWGSKIGFILAAAGSAIGLGNIWKFPYLAGENGGGAFVLVYLVCIIVLGLPIMIAEIVIGRHTAKNPVGAFKIIGNGSRWEFVGYLGVLAGFFIMTYYSVVGGWTIGYIVKSATGMISPYNDVAAAESTFSQFIQNPASMIFYHFLLWPQRYLSSSGALRTASRNGTSCCCQCSLSSFWCLSSGSYT